MLQRILDAWRDVTNIRAEADVEIAEIEAKTKRYIARVSAGFIRPPETPSPEETDEEFRRVVDWAEATFGPGNLADDVIGMWRATRRGKVDPSLRVQYDERLRGLGFPSDW